MRQHEKFENLGSQTLSNWSLLGSIFGNFPEASRWMFCHPFDVFWCPEGPGTFPEWSWIDLGNIIFCPKFLKKSTLYVDLEPSFHWPRIHRIGMSDLKSTSKQLIAHWKKYPSSNEFIDFEIFSFWGCELFKMSEFFKVKTRPALTPYYSTEHQNMLCESFVNIKKDKNWTIKQPLQH